MVGPPAGTPYHRLARTPAHRWWRPIAATVLAAALWAGAATAIAIVGVVFTTLTGTTNGDDQLFADTLLDLAALLLVLALGTPAVMIAARWPQRRPPGTVSSVTGRIRWRWLAACFGVATVTILVMFALIVLLTVLDGGLAEEDLEIGWVGWADFVLPALVIVVLVPFQAAGEEYMFRGWIIQFFGAYLRSPYLGILGGALLFSAAHGLGTTWGFVDLVLFGVVAGWLVVRTGGLEPAIALHAVNNVWAFLLSAAAGNLDNDSTAADSPWQLFAADLVILPAFAIAVLLVARRLRVPLEVPPPPASAL